MLRIVACLSLLLAVSATAIPASAQEPQAPDQLDEAARLTFESARQAFVAGDYERALGLFRQAYQLSPRPGLLYNIAQTLDRLRRDAEALQQFRDFLAAAPDTPNRGEVESRIRVLEQAVANNASAAPATSDGGSGGGGGGIAILHPGIFLAGAGLTVVGAALLIWSGTETMSLNDQYLATTTASEAARLYSAASDQQLLTNAFIGVTAGLAAVSVVLAVLTDWNQLGGGGEHAALRPFFFASHDGAHVGLDASF